MRIVWNEQVVRRNRLAKALCSALSLLFFVTSNVHAVVEPFTSVTVSPDPAGAYANTTFLSSFTTASGTVSDLGHAVLGNGAYEAANNGSDVRNYWGSLGAEIDGPSAVLNLDISTGVVNGGDSSPPSVVDVPGALEPGMNFFFNQTINSGAAGNANDFFLVELGANDTIDIVPLDDGGNAIGDFSLTINNTEWGAVFPGFSRVAESIAPNVSTVGGVAFDLEDFTGSGSLTGVRGIAISGSTGLDALVIGVNSTLAPNYSPQFHVDRTSGEVSLNNAGVVDLNILGYSIKSEVGALNSDIANWKTISGNYDDSTNGGDESVDDDDTWTVLSEQVAGHTDLSEFAFLGDGGTIGAGLSVELTQASGAAWIATSDESDLTAEVTLSDGTTLQVPVVYTGNGDAPLARSDFNHDGNISVADYEILRDNTLVDFTGLNEAQMYALGDVNRDGTNDIEDFVLFVSDFETANGVGSFAAAIQTVPEPSSVCLAAMIGLGVLGLRRKAGLHLATLFLVLATVVGTSSNANAVIFAGDDFESYDLGVDITDAGVGTGGFGWVSDWGVQGGNGAPLSNEIAGSVFTGSGQAVEITNRSSSDNNLLFREFGAQTSDVYIGFTMKSDHSNLTDGDDFLHFYFNDTTANTPGNALGGGVNRGNPSGEGNYFVRKGGGGADDIGNSHVYGEDRTFVFKVSKSVAGVGNIYDEISMWIDQGTEGSPDLFLDAASGTNQAFTQVDTFHVRYTPQPGGEANGAGTLNLDNLVIASTYDEAFAGIVPTPPALKARVNTTNGELFIANDTDGAVTFQSYQLLSDTLPTFDESNWNSLSDQSGINALINPVDGDDPGSIAGDSVGESWEEAGVPSDTSLAEQFLLGDTTLEPGQSISLGNIYDTAVNDTFEFEYFDISQSTPSVGEVEFFVGSAEDADFNADGDVDGGDFLAWQRGFGSGSTLAEGDANGDGNVNAADLSVWSAQYGSNSGGASLTSTAVPEPSGLALLMLATLTALVSKRCPSKKLIS